MSALSRDHNTIVHLMNTRGENIEVMFGVDELKFGGSNKRKFKDLFTYVEKSGGRFTVDVKRPGFTRTTYRGITFTGPAWLLAEVSGYLAEKVRTKPLV